MSWPHWITAFWELYGDKIGLLFSLLAFSLASVATVDWLRRILFSPDPRPHKVAVIGEPRSGKTTIITAIFECVFRGRANPKVTLSGSKTIELINKNIALLESGFPLGPTQEKDVFVYRFRYDGRRAFRLLQPYDVEIADFPGEYSNRLASATDLDAAEQESTLYLFNKEYYAWLLSARVFYFVIDVGALFSASDREAHASEVKARIRSSWQILEDAWIERKNERFRRRVMLVFTKCDMFLAWDEADATIKKEQQTMREYLEELAFASPTKRQTFNPFTMRMGARDLESEFSDLLRFFRSKGLPAEVHFVSAYMFEGSDRYGIQELLAATLPEGG